MLIPSNLAITTVHESLSIILVFSPKQTNILYSLKLKPLKTESKLKPFLIKRLKITICHLDALNYILNVLVLISIIGMKCYLCGTFFSSRCPQTIFFSPHTNWKYPSISDFVHKSQSLVTMTVFSFKVSTLLLYRV